MLGQEKRIGSSENDNSVLMPLFEHELGQLRQKLGDQISSK